MARATSIRVLNRYLEETSNAIHMHGGTVVSFQGDDVMAVLGAPLARADHADHALDCARELVDVSLPRFNEWLVDEGFDGTFDCGVGLASGTLRSGNVGSQDRVEYAAIGDATNTAARLQALTRESDVAVLVAGSVVERLSTPALDLAEVGERVVRGKSAAVRIFTFAALDAATDRPPASTLTE